MNLIASILMSVFPHTLPQGLFNYQGAIVTENIRIAESLLHNTSSGKERMAELKKDQFVCIRQNQTRTICSKNTGSVPTKESIQNAVAQKLNRWSVEFYPLINDPEMYQSLSDKDIWQIESPVRIGSRKVNIYQFVHDLNQFNQSVTFPVNEDQPIGHLTWTTQPRHQLGLTLVVSEKINHQTYGHILTAYLQPSFVESK